nr:DNA-binding protein [uncultured Dorea sp.]
MGKTIPTTVRIPEALKSDLEQIAERESRSLNNLINIILQSYVNENKKK